MLLNCNMELHSNFNKKSNDRKTSNANTCLSPKAKQKTLGSILNFDQCDRTHNDFHPQFPQNAQKSKGFHEKQQVEMKPQKSEELVMYMSCLPSYLERGENPQDKPLNIGVLDWRLLQKWQYGNSDIVGVNGDPSPSFISSKVSRSQFLETDGIVSGLKGNGVIHKGEASRGVEHVSCSAVIDRHYSEGCKTAEPVFRNDPGSRHSAVGHLQKPDSSTGHNNRSQQEIWYTYYGGSSMKVCHTKSRSEYTRFSSVATECGKIKDTKVEKSFVKDIKSVNRPSGKEQIMRFPESVSISPSRRNNLEKKNTGSKPRTLHENGSFQMKVGCSESTKFRNPSPTQRLSFDAGRLGKSSYSNSARVNLVSENIPDSAVTSTSCSKYSTPDKSNAASRARLSPLRRLLDPILKPEKNPSKTDRTLKLVDNGGSHHAQKNVTSSMQALLQVAVKNGLPLFTFTVDNHGDILAATVKELGSNKNIHSWIYTFFSFSETKKKNNGHWINQGSKDRSHGYISNIVAQMKVSDINCIGREFVLSSVGVDQTSDSLPGDELAAIVVKFPERMSTQRGTFGIPQVGKFSNSEDECESHGAFSTTVILPGGHHGAPSKGEPSPLIERWKSGGSCDCGGWDLGCQLMILANSKQSNWRFKSTKSELTSFKLFSQEEVEEKRPVFVLSPFEDGIFSVEYNSTLKLIQAFSISLAVLHSRKLTVLPSNTFGGKMYEEIMASENTLWKSFSQAQVEVSAKYATNPPLSPVSRV